MIPIKVANPARHPTTIPIMVPVLSCHPTADSTQLVPELPELDEDPELLVQVLEKAPR